MSVLSDERISFEKWWVGNPDRFNRELTKQDFAWQAWQAAIAADRAARAEPVGWYFADDPKVYTLPGGGFRLGKEKPEDTLFAVPLYTASPVPETKEQ